MHYSDFTGKAHANPSKLFRIMSFQGNLKEAPHCSKERPKAELGKWDVLPGIDKATNLSKPEGLLKKKEKKNEDTEQDDLQVLIHVYAY